MKDGIVLILDASHLCPRFEIDPSTYIPSDIRYLDTAACVDMLCISMHGSQYKPWCLATPLNVYCYFGCRSNGVPLPLVIAAHPRKPNQFALGLSDGGVLVVEPEKSEDEWVHTADDTQSETTPKL